MVAKSDRMEELQRLFSRIWWSMQNISDNSAKKIEKTVDKDSRFQVGFDRLRNVVLLLFFDMGAVVYTRNKERTPFLGFNSYVTQFPGREAGLFLKEMFF